MNYPIYKSSDLLQKAGVVHGFFTRVGGMSQGDYSSLNCKLQPPHEVISVIHNRILVARSFGFLLERLIIPKQLHGNKAITITKQDTIYQQPLGDALVTNDPRLLLGILTADCVPVLCAYPELSIVAAAHAGWRGATSGIIENTIAAMVELGAQRAGIIATIGPAIAFKSYEVDAIFRENIYNLIGDAAGQFFNGIDPCFFDLPGFVAWQLKEAGVEQIETLPFDTLSDDEFFSHRRQCLQNKADSGRQISVISAKKI